MPVLNIKCYFQASESPVLFVCDVSVPSARHVNGLIHSLMVGENIMTSQNETN